jgi:hypothetical protein
MLSRYRMAGCIVVVCLLTALAGLTSCTRENAGGHRHRGLTWEEQEEKGRREFAAGQAERARWLTTRIDEEPERGPIRCILRRAGAGPEKAELALMNEGDRPRRFWHTVFGLKEHVTMALRDYLGEVVAHLDWSLLSSSTIRKGFIVPARDVLVEEVSPSSILHNHHGPRLEPGRYWLQAIFEYHDPGERMFSRSERIPVEVDGDRVRVVAD